MRNNLCVFMHAPCGTRIHTGRFGVSYPILLDERSVFSELPAPDSNRQMRQSKCRALAFWRAGNSYPGRTRTASYENQNLAPSQFGDRASFQPAAEKYYVQFPYTVSGVQFGSELLLPGRPRRHVRLPSVLYTAFLFCVRFPAALTSARSDRAKWATWDSNPDLAD